MNNRFDQEASQWDQQEPRVKMAVAIAEAMSRSLRLGSDRDLLDFGTGTGLIALRFQPHVRRVFAFDTSVGMLRALGDKLSQNRITNIELVQGLPSETMPKLPAVDIIVSSMALHHVRDILGLARAFKTALRRGGQLAIADLDPEGGLFHADHADVMHDGFDRKELAGILVAAGFSDIEFSDAYVMEKPIADGTLRPFTIFLVTAQG
jgi:ubiquinone/menaquinone biosynthesis C-methylase UbiE